MGPPVKMSANSGQAPRRSPYPALRRRCGTGGASRRRTGSRRGDTGKGIHGQDGYKCNARNRRRALLRRLQAAETLGGANVICTDKTGTLTENEMTVQHIWLPSGALEVSGTGYAPEGVFQVSGESIDVQRRQDLLDLLLGRNINPDLEPALVALLIPD